MKGLDNWITGHYGEDNPDNQLCKLCGKDADYHCEYCGECTPDGAVCDTCRVTDRPDHRMIVVCEGCGKYIHIDNADLIGRDLNPHFVCLDKLKCMREFAERYVLSVEDN